jgi:hypothetical protein
MCLKPMNIFIRLNEVYQLGFGSKRVLDEVFEE